MDLPLPPEVLLDAGPAGGEEVVEVHDDVDAHVQETAERGVTAAHVPAQQIRKLAARCLCYKLGMLAKNWKTYV
jgi:hypothetical protein